MPHAAAAVLAIVLMPGLAERAGALDISVGDLSVSVGLDSGLDVGVGVGSTAEIGASVGTDGVSASIGLGTGEVSASVGVGTGTPDPTPGTAPTPSGVATPASGPSREQVAEAARRSCTGTGNSDVYTDYIVYDRAGLAVGVVKSANVGTDLRVQRLTVSTLTSFLKPAECLTLSDRKLQIGAGAMQLSYTGNTILRAIATR